MKEKVRKIKVLSDEGHRIIDACLRIAKNSNETMLILRTCLDLAMYIFDEIYAIADDIDRSLQ